MSISRQPKAVWAVASACVIAFLGIGLVDPILPVLAQDLDATPSQVSLLFTSYFAITGLSMRGAAQARAQGGHRGAAAGAGPRGLLTAGLVALVYNFGFFTLLAYTPFPLGMGAHALGLVFFGWGLLLALSSVFAAPPLKRRFGIVRTLGAMYAALALILAVMGVGSGSPALLAVAVIVAGAVLGVVNTVLTEAVMRIAPVERPIASSAYSFVRFAGGAVAPWLAGKLVAGRASFAEREEVEAVAGPPVAPVLVAVAGDRVRA